VVEEVSSFRVSHFEPRPLAGFPLPVVAASMSPVANCIPRSQNFRIAGSAKVAVACPSEQ
jgi:hypothetical protein